MYPSSPFWIRSCVNAPYSGIPGVWLLLFSEIRPLSQLASRDRNSGDIKTLSVLWVILLVSCCWGWEVTVVLLWSSHSCNLGSSSFSAVRLMVRGFSPPCGFCTMSLSSTADWWHFSQAAGWRKLTSLGRYPRLQPISISKYDYFRNVEDNGQFWLTARTQAIGKDDIQVFVIM